MTDSLLSKKRKSFSSSSTCIDIALAVHALGGFPTLLSMSRSNAFDRRNSGGGISGTANADNGPIREGTEIPGKALLELCYRLAGSVVQFLPSSNTYPGAVP